MKFVPKYDKKFLPMIVVFNEFREEVKKAEHKTLKICVERNDGYNYVYNLDIFSDSSKNERNYQIAERIIKSILWVIGGYKIYLCGDDYIYERIKDDYTLNGARKFDVEFMEQVYELPFVVIKCDENTFPKEKKLNAPIFENTCYRQYAGMIIEKSGEVTPSGSGMNRFWRWWKW